MTNNTLSSSAFKQQLSAIIPDLRAFARSLCNNPTLADDIAQEAMLKAWKARDRYEAGTNLKAWCFTILRNHFYSEKRRSWRRQPLDPEVAEATLVANDDASQNMELLAVRNALAKLPDDQREALILVGAGGMAYDEAAEICECAIGTIKSRVSRARRALEELLDDPSNSYSSDDDMTGEDVFEDIMDQAEALAKQ
jgi:RNA polymerase sigma-70 factor (ECF subfamily)